MKHFLPLETFNLVLGFVLIQIQVRLEEEFLAEMHGADYDEFRRRVRRWM